MKRLQQLMIEEKYNRKAIRGLIMKDIQDSDLGQPFEDAMLAVKELLGGSYYESKDIRLHAIKDLDIQELVQEVLAAVLISSEPQPIQAVAARIALHLPYENKFDGIKTAAELIAVIGKGKLFTIIAARNSDTGSLMVSTNLQLDPEVIAKIEQTKYLPPMICKPNHISGKGNKDTSHLTFVDSLLLGKENNHKKPISVDVINIVNAIELSLDEDILQFEEESNKDLDTFDKVKQFNNMCEESVKVYNEIIETGNRFHLTWKYDFRGRIYSQGYYINLQSQCYKKALISLAKQEVIAL